MCDTLTDEELTRYDRQIRLTGWGQTGQLKLKKARVFIAGAGGLGSAASLYLATAGVGKLCICDADTVELSNLNRQILHSENDLGKKKTTSANNRLSALNSIVKVVPLTTQLDENNVEKIVGAPDIMIDCLDNYQTRYLLNDYCLRKQIPLVHAGIYGFIGQVSFIEPPRTPCLRCFVPHPPKQQTIPVVGATAGLVGSIQAMEALKYLLGLGDLLAGRLLIVDGHTMRFITVQVEPDPQCPTCSQ